MVRPDFIRFAIWTVLVHAIVSSLHGAAHQNLGVQLSPLQIWFVAIVITIAPVVAGVLLWKRLIGIGAVILASSMAGSLIFGVYNHFIGISPDHVSHLDMITNTPWIWVFQSTAVINSLVEAFGIWIGLRILKSGLDLSESQ